MVGGLDQLGISLATSTSYKILMIGLVGLYIHFAWADLPQAPYVRLICALWSLEYAWRAGRIIQHNLHRVHGITQVSVKSLPAEACRVTFDIVRPWPWLPGCYMYMYLPAYGWFSCHPFSVAWAEKHEGGGISSAAINEALVAHKLKADATDPKALEGGIAKPTRTRSALNTAPLCDSLSFVVRARSGFTRKLYENAASTPSGTVTTWGVVEGPYGGHKSMTSYGTVIFFAAGVGITPFMSHIQNLLSKCQAGTTATRKILLIWSIPNTDVLDWVRPYMKKILRMEGAKDVFKIELFLTKPRHPYVHWPLQSIDDHVQRNA